MPTFPRRPFPGPAVNADALSSATTKGVRAKRATAVTQTTPQNKRDPLIALACAAFVISLLLCLHPFADVPRNDDFSYARTAESLAVTGRIAYNGWGSPIILPQAVYGALLVRAFGFSRDVLDASGIAAAGLCAFLLYLLSRASRVPRVGALLCVGVLVLNAPFLAVAPSFMNDLPSLALLLAALLLLVRSLPDERDTNGAASAPPQYGLFAVAVILGVIAGSSRQNNWAAVAGALLALAGLRRNQWRMAGLGAAALVAGAGLTLRWFNEQPYTVPVDIAEGLGVLLTPRYLPNWMMYVYRLLNMMGLFLLPVALFALRPARDLRRPGFWIALILCALPLVWPLGLATDSPLALHGSFYGLSEYGKYFTSRGVLVGGMHGMNDQPFVLPVALGHALKGAGAIGLALTAYLATSRLRRRMAPLGAQLAFWSTLAQFAVSFPFFAASHISDRYILFFLPGLSVVLLTNQLREGNAEDAAAEGGASRVCVAAAMTCLGFMAVTGGAMAASYMNYTRAQAVLYRRMEARGYARREIDGGADWNLDTQVVEEGKVNNPAMTPTSAFRKNAQGAFIEPMAIWYPALDAHIVFSLNRDVPLPFAVETEPVDAENWTSVLPPARRTIYALKVQR